MLAGCGYTGERCAEFFCADGWDVTALVSSDASAKRLEGKPYPVFAADASDPGQLRSLSGKTGRPDVLVHCLSGHGSRDAAAYRVTYVETLRHLLEIFSPRFTVFTGSTSVYPQNDGSIVTEDSPVGGTPTGDVLLEAERLALESGGAVVRLGGIYGPGRARFIEAVLSGEPMPQGAPDAFINLIHRDDAARALFHVGSKRLAGIFNAVDDNPSRRADLAAAIATTFNRPVPPIPDTPPTGKKVANTKLRATGWTPRYPSVPEALQQDPILQTSSSDR